MAWHLGYPLSQTLLTSVYIEAMLVPEPTRIEEADFIRNHQGDSTTRDPMFVVLRAYCLGLLKVCWYVHERIKFEHYYEVSVSLKPARSTFLLTGLGCKGGRLCDQHVPPIIARQD